MKSGKRIFFLAFVAMANSVSFGQDIAQVPLSTAQVEFKAKKKGGLETEKIQAQTGGLVLSVEGDWGSPDDSEEKVSVVARVPIRVPLDYKFIAVEKSRIELPPTKETAEYRESVLEIPIRAVGESTAEFRLVATDGTSSRYTAFLRGTLSETVVIASPGCEDSGLGIEAQNDVTQATPMLFLLNCAKNETELLAAIRPIANPHWRDFPSSGKKLLNGGELVLKDPDETGLPFSFAAAAAPKAAQDSTATSSDEVVYEYRIKKGVASAWGRTWYGQFQVTGLAGFQSGGGSSFSGEFIWKPSYIFKTKPWMIRGNLGVSLFNAAAGGEIFATDVQALAAYSGVKSWLFELGGGIQTWWGFAGTNPILSANAARLFNKKFLKVINQVVGGYSLYLFPGYPTHEIRLGVGIAF